jgi:Tol biopolymer transport system component/predicted Ser/Thr protein kinase
MSSPSDHLSWQRARSVFEAVADLPAAQRAARLTELCGGDDGLRREVESLLAHDRPAGVPDESRDIIAAIIERVAQEAMDEPLHTGQALLHYEVTGEIGRGGMGIVWRATDRTLGRDVAIKVLPSAVARDPSRLARFDREAKVLASLNHPNIAGIHSLHESNGIRFLAMEYIEGEDLTAHLARGKLSLAKVLSIAGQVADGLDEAHQKGIVHRDLKPANIKITPSGQVKVLDFGLAKAMGQDVVGRPTGDASAATEMASHSTHAGLILGTATYMAPEQARGLPVDRRADVWSFGVLLFEMLAGAPPFAGATLTDVLAAVISTEPDWQQLPTDTPPELARLIRRCLEKDARQRWRDIGDARIELDALLQDVPGRAPVQDSGPQAAGQRTAASATVARPARTGAGWKAATLLLGVTTAAAAVGWYQRQPAAAAPVRFHVFAPPSATFAAGTRPGASAAIAPDGRTIAFTATTETGPRLLWLRPIDSLEARPLAGTDDAAFPFWSPDSQSIGYSVPGRLMKIGVAGGPAQTLCALSGPAIVSRGGTWHPSGVIVFNNGQAPLFRVPSTGGDAIPIGTLVPGETSRQFPAFLPDGDHVLYHATGSVREVGGLYVTSLSTGATTRLTAADTGAVFDPRARHLLFGRQGVLLAQPFDTGTRALSGVPVPVADRLDTAAVPGIAAFSVSDTGVLVYGIGDATVPPSELAWVGRDGRSLGTIGPPGNYRGIDLSHDGTRIAVHRHDGEGGDVWLIDTTSGATSRFTFEAAQDNSSPAWSSDDRQLAFASSRNGRWSVQVKPADGTGSETRAGEVDDPGALAIGPMSWHPSAAWLTFGVFHRATQWDLWRLQFGGRAVPLLHATTFERHGQVSPDGRWLAYMSRATGINEIYIAGLSPSAGKWAVSSGGGTVPRWRADGRELYYLSAGRMMAVDVATRGAALAIGESVPLFPYSHANVTHPDYFPYAVSNDGVRFLLTREMRGAARGPADMPLVVATRWAEALAR